MYTQHLVGWKRNQKLRVVMVLGDPSCPIHYGPDSPADDRSIYLCPGAGRSFQQEVPQQEHPSEVHPRRKRGKEDMCLSPALLTWGFVYHQVCFHLLHSLRIRSCSSSDFQVSQTEVTVHRKRQSPLAQWSH